MAVDFKVGDLVWARMKGFPAWPGRVIEPKPEVKKPAKKGSFVFVFFFGSENYAWISTDGVWPYRQNKDKFNLTTRAPKYFKEALEAAEEASSLHSSAHPGASADGENMFPDRSPSLQAESPAAKQARQRTSNGAVVRRSGQQESVGGSGDDGDASKAAIVSAAEAGTVGAGTSTVDGSAAVPAAAPVASTAHASGAGSDGPHVGHTEVAAAFSDDGYSTPQPSTSRARGKGSRRRAVVRGRRGDGSAMPAGAAPPGSGGNGRGVTGSSRGGGAAGMHGRSPRRKKPGTVVADAASRGDGVLVDPLDVAASTSPAKRRGKVKAASDQAAGDKQQPTLNGKASKDRRRARPAVAVDVDSKGSVSAQSPAVTLLSTPVKRGRPAAGSAEPAASAERRRTLLPADEPASKRSRVTSPRTPRHAAEDGVDRAVADVSIAGSPRRRVLNQSSRRSASAQRQSRLSSAPSSSPLRHVRESDVAAGDGSTQAPVAGALAEANAAAKSPARRRLPSSAADHRDKPAAAADGSLGKDRLVGFLGLGVMGTKMVQRLMKAGYQLLVWNRTQARCDDLVAQGARFGETPADVVRQCDITFSCVSDPFALKELVFGDCGVLMAISPGKLYVDMSTVDIDTSKDIDEAIAAKGGLYVEAPVMGGHVHGFKQAEALDLVALAGGSADAVRRCHSHLTALAGKVVHVGDVGSGACMKLCSSAVVGVTAAAIAECATLAERLGLKRADFFDVLCPAMRVFEASGSSAAAARAGPATPGPSTIVDAMIATDFTVDFALKHQQKDLRLTIDMADMVDKPMLVTAAANEFYKLAKAHGYGSMDVSAVWKAAQQQ